MSADRKSRDGHATPWRTPTRRAFFAMLGAAAAALAVRDPARLAADAPGDRRRAGRRTIWIGHC